ncbi:hypothetical protein ABZS71_28155, partial [Streptomyces sp. NPDC005393]|uniref:hypothetical protein n=1 Tax=Streptomyces sp. NPDC005393 TaxID=3157041 RepID=UPI0033AEBD38
ILRDSVQASLESVARNMHAMSMVQQQVLDGLAPPVPAHGGPRGTRRPLSAGGRTLEDPRPV